MSQLSSISSLTSPHPASYAAAAAGSAASGTSSSSAAAHSNMPAGSSDSNKKRRTDTDAQQTALMAQLRELTSNTEATANKVSSMQQWFKKEHIQKPFKLFCNKFKRLLQEQHKANHAVKELTNHKTRGSIPKSMKIKGVSLPQAQASFLQESNEKRIQYEKDQLDIALRCRQAELDSANNEVKNFFTVVTSTITATVTRDDQAVLEFTKQNQTIDLTSVTASLPVPDELINFFLDSIKGSMRDTIISIANSEANLKKKKDDEHSQAMEMDEKVESDPQKSTTELIQLQVAQLVPKELVKLGISTQRSSSSEEILVPRIAPNLKRRRYQESPMLNLSLMTLIPKTGLRLQVNAVINLGDNLVRTKATTAVYPSRKRTRINNRLLRRNLIRVQKTRRAHVTVKVPVPETKVLNAIRSRTPAVRAKDPGANRVYSHQYEHS